MPTSPAFVAVLVAAIAAPAAPAAAPSSPAPQDTPLREIARVRSSGACDLLDRLVKPVTAVTAHNDQEFSAVRSAIDKFYGGKGADSLGAAMHNAFTNDPNLARTGVETQAQYTVDPLAFGEEDSTGSYSPVRTMAASNIDRLTGEIQHNLDAADKAMRESWKSHPGTDDPAINALRQRVQNVIDLQRVLAQRLDAVAGLYFSNDQAAQSKRLVPDADRAAYESRLVTLLDAEAALEQAASNLATQTQPPMPPPDSPVGNVETLKRGPAGDVTEALLLQEVALSFEAPRVGRSCTAPAASPAPSPSP
jgi:hypothetical protein